jgi:hypothetical protein
VRSPSKKFVFLLVFLLSLTSGFAGNPFEDMEINVQATAGVRHGDFDWNIAASDNSPNILSELSWTDLRIMQVKVRGDFLIKDTFYLRAMVSNGYIVNGNNQDSDYTGDNRTQEYSRSNNDISGNLLDEIKVGAGYRFKLTDPDGHMPLEIIPFVGYSSHSIEFNMVKGYQSLPQTGAFYGLDSTYQANYSGLWYGLEVRATFFDHLEMLLSYDRHVTDYRSEADWNLRSDFEHPVSFKNETDFYGRIWELTLHYRITENWRVALNMEHQLWDSDSGTNTQYFQSGVSRKTRLNEVNYESKSIGLGVGRKF